MNIHVKHFDRDKALEVILFIAQKLRTPTFHSISKMIYLSDKHHLGEYGRLICGDRYIAMEYGPVPSAIYNMMKVAKNSETVDVDWDEIIREAIAIEGKRNVIVKRDCNLDLLSDSEIECIEATIGEYGESTFGELTDITHDQAWRATDENQTISIEAIANTLVNAPEVLSYLEVH